MAVPGGSSPLNPLFQIIAFGAGTAMGPVLRPAIQDLEYEAWRLAPVRVPAATLLAQGVAQGQVDAAVARQWARDTGFADDRWDAMVSIANVGPGVAAAYDMWRRNVVGEAGFRRAVKRLGLEPEWIDHLVALHDIRLSPATVANAVQQGHMPNAGILPSIDPTIPFPAGYRQPQAPDDAPASSVPLTTINLDPIEEAAAAGIDLDRLKVDANLSGLPPGPEALLAMWNRNLIDQDAVDAGIREGHMKTKWAHAYKRMRWAVLSGPEYAELHLRDWITEDEMNKGGALTGHTPEQMQRLFQNRGRTATPRQVWLAAARNKIGPRGVVTTQLDHEQAIRRSNIRPEYSDMLWEIRFNYPPLFQLNRLVQVGAIPPATAAEWATWSLYGPEVVDALTKYWQQIYPGADAGAGAAADPLVKAEQRKVLTRIANVYTQTRADEAQARGWLTDLGIDGTVQDGLIQVWDVARQVPGAGLTRKQLKDAFGALPLQWPRARVLQELEDLGMEPEEAQTYLDE